MQQLEIVEEKIIIFCPLVNTEYIKICIKDQSECQYHGLCSTFKETMDAFKKVDPEATADLIGRL